MQLTVPSRFNGPPGSGNGGWVSGLLAQALVAESDAARSGPVTVRLTAPPPLETPLTVTVEAGVATLRDGEAVVATARPGRLTDPAAGMLEPVTPDAARAASERYDGLVAHPFPTCVVCGPRRDAGDGLRVFAGALEDGTGRYAALWQPGDEIAPPFVWAALDCPGGWSAGIAGRPMVLGTMTTELLAPPRAGEPHLVLSWPEGGEGRKFHSGSAVFTVAGDLLARAEATWIALPEGTP